MQLSLDQIKQGAQAGAQKGWSGLLWMLKILIPISFFSFLLEASGLLGKIDFLLEPLMGFLYLPSAAALPLLIGLLTGIYGGIAAMIPLSLSADQMTLIAIFLLISHNLVQEGVIQGKSGIHPLTATLVRLAASVVTVWSVAQFIHPDGDGLAKGAAVTAGARTFVVRLGDWALETVQLSLKICLIIMVLMMVLEIMKRCQLIDRLVHLLAPVLKAIGLDRRVGFLWLTAVVFGIAYGGAVIVEEAKDGRLSRENLEKLHLSIGINHSMVEDPALFLSLGLNAFWLWIPRLLMAILVVRLYDVWIHVRKSKRLDFMHKKRCPGPGVVDRR